jgi:hypothetical protein
VLPGRYCGRLPASGTQVVYLDLGLWYELGEANAGHPRQPTHPEILAKLAVEVEQGRLQFPLSEIHYMELTENPRGDQRKEAADVMAVLSRFVTVAPLGRIVDEELARSLNQLCGRPAFPIKVPKFGRGVRYAFGETLDPKTQITELEEYLAAATPDVMRAQIPNYDPYAGRRRADIDLDNVNVMLIRCAQTPKSQSDNLTRSVNGS